MKLGKVFIGLLVLIFVAGCSKAPHPAANEPIYQNRRLSEWLRDFDDSSRPQTQAMAADAVRHIGTAALPFLVEQLSEDKEKRFREELQHSQEKQIAANYSVPRLPDPRFEALSGLDALGSEAAPALPVLEKLLRQDESFDPCVMYVIARTGPASVPLLNQMSTDEVKVIRIGAGVCLNLINTHSEVLYPPVPVGPNTPSLNRRICEFNLKMLQAAFQVYKAEHPESFSLNQEVDALPTPPALPK